MYEFNTPHHDIALTSVSNVHLLDKKRLKT